MLFLNRISRFESIFHLSALSKRHIPIENGLDFPSVLLFCQLHSNEKKYICKFYATKWQTYHYFEIVYVKVIFLHVDSCYYVF